MYSDSSGLSNSTQVAVVFSGQVEYSEGLTGGDMMLLCLRFSEDCSGVTMSKLVAELSRLQSESSSASMELLSVEELDLRYFFAPFALSLCMFMRIGAFGRLGGGVAQ